MNPVAETSVDTGAVYLNAAEVASLLRISVRTLHTYVQRERIPSPIWLGGKRLWCAQSVHDFLGTSRLRRRRRF